MFKFLHTADIHLDSPLLNLTRFEDVPRDEFRSSTRRAFDNIVSLAIEHQVAFVLIAGDLYDGDCSNMQTPIYLRDKFRELDSHHIRVFIIHGNHDAESNMTKAFALEMPDNVHLFSTKQPETVQLAELSVAIHGQGFHERAVTDDLSLNYPAPIPGFVNVGMLHTSCGEYAAHDSYAPSTCDGLDRLGYDYWALGHIHKKQRLKGPNPWIIYPGNPQGRHIRETGPRSCVIATCDGDSIEVEESSTDVVRWYEVDVDLTDCDDERSILDYVLDQIADQRCADGDNLPLAVRLRLTGATDIHYALKKRALYWDTQIREGVLSRFDRDVWVEKIAIRTEPPVKPHKASEHFQDLVEEILEPALVAEAYDQLRPEFDKLLNSLPCDPRLGGAEIDLSCQATLDELARDAQDLLVGRLLDGGSDQ